MLVLPLHRSVTGPLLFSPDGLLLLVQSPDRLKVRVYDAVAGRLLWGGHTPHARAAFTPDGRRVTAGTVGFDARTGDPAPPDPPAPPTGPADWWRVVARPANGPDVPLFGADEVARSPDGRLVAVAVERAVLVLAVADLVGNAVVPAVGLRLGGGRGVRAAAAFGPDGGTLLTGGADGLARVWDAATGRERARFAPAAGRLLGVAVSPDGLRAAVAGHKRIVIWDLD